MGGGRQPQRPAVGLAWQQAAQEKALATALEACMPHASECRRLQRAAALRMLGTLLMLKAL